ncbi:MarR family EPS-associated transcriptional regulator [Rhizobacter sp. AJA081-3]|uniref:MarR family EPS-associated transcriptional regulator n=1 Tax=Rhizobacter sp. AJA081-3 TaxID=2753607 RepID=UPI001AE08D18|nr:MarR family EPS-associated transcriptional regulator [Rhizobacter sp. AJA081-3]QTN24273.1 MarR family EPS-associated transcriptional regulator [Rhizobacter sp. AJA081-3]
MNAPLDDERAHPDVAETERETTLLLSALRLLSEEPRLSQRQLSNALGLSLGKTHYVLHALLDKGLLKVQNFRRNDNKVAYAYLLTPKGLREKLTMTRAFLVRKEAEFERLHSTIEELRNELQRSHPPGSAG